MGIIKKQKQSTYLEDAKKMVSRAEYMVRSNTEVKKPANNNCIVMTLGYLDNGEFNSPPYGGAYFSNLSYVVIKNVNGKYAYYVQLYECETPQKETSSPGSGGYVETLSAHCNSTSGTGLKLWSSTDQGLNKPKSIATNNNIPFNTTTYSYTNSSGTATTTNINCSGSINKYYSNSTTGVTTVPSTDQKKEVIYDYN
jgi:hypothetical protein